MNKIYIFCLVLLTSVSYSQKEFWGLCQYNNNSSLTFGNIFKTDINGQNREVVHLFDETHGKHPVARLFLASNGKLYGTTTKGGSFFSEANNGGVMFEYDLILDQYKVVANFGENGLTREPFSDLIEPVPGILFGASLYRIFRYNIASQTTSISVVMPEYNNGSFNLRNNLNDQLVKASDGFIYGMTAGAAGCVGSASQAAGTIIKINPLNNTYSQPYIFTCFPNESGNYPRGSLVEGSSGKLYGTTESGGINDDGTLFEFNIITNTYTKKFDFHEFTSGRAPRNLMSGNNGKLYGITNEGGNNPCIENDHRGTLFEYDLSSGIVTTLVNMGCDGNFSYIGRPHGTLLKASNGFIYGTCFDGPNDRGIFRFDPITNTAINACPAQICPNVPNLMPGLSEGLIEICRKPTYHFFDVDTFDACLGSTFTYNIQNTNATTYQWLKDGTNVPDQTTAILNLTNITASDAGNYTCLMTNECGTTTTMALHLTVNCLGTDTFANLDKVIKLYPNPTKNILNIKLPENIAVTINNTRIANSLGQIVQEQKIQNNHTIDVSQLQNGIYFISLNTNYGNWNGKFIKE